MVIHKQVTIIPNIKKNGHILEYIAEYVQISFKMKTISKMIIEEWRFLSKFSQLSQVFWL